MNFRTLRKSIVPQGFSLAARRRWRDSVLARWGLERSYKPYAIIERPSLCVDSMLKFVVAHELANNANLSFVQIGAYDGIGADDLHDLVIQHNLRGLLIEPQPSAFARLQETYADQPQVTLLNAAIADQDGMRQLFCPREGDAMVASFDREHLIRHGIRPHEIIAREVPCYTILNALQSAGMSNVDLLQIDAEGYDFEILKSIDFARIQPAIIRFEHRHLSPLQANESINLLASHGYQFVMEKRDIIACRSQAFVKSQAA